MGDGGKLFIQFLSHVTSIHLKDSLHLQIRIIYHKLKLMIVTYICIHIITRTSIYTIYKYTQYIH